MSSFVIWSMAFSMFLLDLAMSFTFSAKKPCLFSPAVMSSEPDAIVLIVSVIVFLYLAFGDSAIDRLIFSPHYEIVECMVLLIAIKINFPKKFVLLRGNHESRNMTESFTFRDEVIQRFDVQVYDAFMELFDSLPIACVVDDKYLAMHGGISPDLNLIEDINDLNRF